MVKTPRICTIHGNDSLTGNKNNSVFVAVVCTLEGRLLSVSCGSDRGPHYDCLHAMLVFQECELTVTLISKWLWIKLLAERPE